MVHSYMLYSATNIHDHLKTENKLLNSCDSSDTCVTKLLFLHISLNLKNALLRFARSGY